MEEALGAFYVFLFLLLVSWIGFKREVETIAEKKYNMKVGIEDIWKMKSRLVCGERINL